MRSISPVIHFESRRPRTLASDAFNEKVTLQILEIMAQEAIHLSGAGPFVHGEQAPPV